MLRQNLGAGASSRFEIVGPLGAGGFGAVYEAIDVRTRQRVALKELDNTSADSIARFKHEFRALADCHHPNLVALHELIEESGRWLIVMELVPGSDLSDYVRADASTTSGHQFDEGRVRSALSGMVEGLRALHGYGILHRDLKPSNVRVRPDGRAILLDFGLATSSDPKQQSTQVMVGTVRYMAPEQAAGKSLSPATDLYALGVCLFEALTGQAPFDADQAIAILLAKQQREAPRASTLQPDVPGDLDALCARLLAIDPTQRPSADEVLQVLGGGAVHASTFQQAALLPAEELFAGRERELEHLERALAGTHRGELRIMLVEGESGVGKSELVAEFLRRAAQRHPTLVALRGRCYENEQVSYKAFDGCIDELSKFLRRLPEAESTALLPVRAALLGQLFPVLRDLRALARATHEGVSADPTARRLEAFEALGALLGKLAEERPLILVVDDLQWADAESFRMLQALVEHATPPPLLLLATIRPREELESELLDHVKALRSLQNTDVVPLFGLPREQAHALAAKLLGPGAPTGWLAMIAEESDGHPLFLSELVQYTQNNELGSRGRLSLDAALRARIEQLPKRERDLLELVALAARPHGAHVFAHALSVPNVDEPARTLLAAKLLKLRKGQELGCFHDRIRRTASELVASARSIALHRKLALALEAASEVDPVEQARHWDLAGDSERAIAAYELAIERAIETLAFTRAEQLCARAIELVGNSGDARSQELRIKRAHALSCAGRSHESALLFQQAADRAHGDVRTRLRGNAAQQLMLSGKSLEGFAAARALLRDLGVRLPIGTAASLLRFVWDSLCLALAARRTRPRGETAPALRVTLEIVQQVGTALSLVHPITMLTITTQQLRLAQRSGSVADRARALVAYGWLVTMRRSLAHALPVFERSRSLVQDDIPPRTLAALAYTEGSARIAGFDWAGGSACLERAEQLGREHCPDEPWLITHIRYHLGVARYHLGEHARLVRDSELWLAEVRERNDPMGEALLSGLGHGFLRHLMRDAPEQALEEHARVAAAISPEPFAFAHFGLFMMKTLTLFYQGGPAGMRWLDSFGEERKRPGLLKTAMGRDSFLAFYSQALLHAYVGAAADEQPELLQRAKRIAHKLERRSPLMQTIAHLVFAQVAALNGQRERALESARTARVKAESLGHGLRRHAMLLEGLLEGGEAGRLKREGAVEAYGQQGWRVPLRGIAISLPTLHVLLDADPTAKQRARLLAGRYELLSAECDRSSGSVVAVRDVESGRRLALKELVRSSGKPLERFKREFRALQDLHHANLGRLDALLEHEGRWYITMELVEGSDLLSYVRPRGRIDVTRLSACIAGVARALGTLHEAGFIHRHVTPENIRVGDDERVVLLDYGSIARLNAGDETTLGGSADHASPEQLSSATPTTSSDVYALGTCLYQGLFGRPPFAGSPAEQRAQKRTGPSRVSVEASLEPLYALCLRMLAPDPARRPTLREIIRTLSGDHAESERPERGAPELDTDENTDARFAGREAELAKLADAFEETCDVGFTLAFVEGESGVGKSSLVSEFAQKLAARSPALHVLHSRCYENEQLAFKAFDGAVDKLARILRSLSNPQCEALMPKRAALLAQLFPVLTSVPAIAQATKKGLPADPAAQKLAARTCFLELLENLSTQLELLFVVDDLQWADSESLSLLHALAAQRMRLPLLFLCTIRPDTEIPEEAAHEIAGLRALPETREIVLEGLSPTAARELALQLYGAPITEAHLATLVQESKGHPLFLRELIAYEKRATGGGASAAPSLDEALRSHIDGLSEQARELLMLAALAGRPLGVQLYALAMQVAELSRTAIVTLLGHGLLRRRGDGQLSCYHDRIRRVALEALSAQQRKSLARKLASALATSRSAEPAECARLWDEAEERTRAIDAYEQAGGRALAALAFTRAEQHYGRALELLESEPSADREQQRGRLLEQRGHALVRAGRSAEAARLYQRAAERAEGEARVRLRIAAAQHLIQSAQIDEGMRAAGDLLRELDAPLPASDRAALARIAWERARLRIRGIELNRKRHKPSTHSARLLLDALHGLSNPVSAICYLPGSMLMVEYLRRALDAGEPSHAARALSFEAMLRTLSSPDRDQDALFTQSQKLAELASMPSVMAEVELSRGIACIARNQFMLAPTHISNAHELLQTRCPGEPWLLTNARRYLGFAWFYVGDLLAIERHTGAWLDEAKARDDRYATAALCGFGYASLRHLVRNRPDEALSELDWALKRWPEEPFSTNHLGVFAASSSALAYARPETLLEWLERQRERHAHSYLMRTAASRFMEQTMFVGAILRKAQEARADQRGALLSRAEREIRLLRRNPSKAAVGLSAMFLGTVQAARGDRASALHNLAQASAQLSPSGIFWGPIARYLEGRVEGGEAGRVKSALLLEKLRCDGWVDQERALMFRVPGVRLLE